MDAEERYQQKRLGYIKLSLNEMHGIPFKQVFINRVDTRFHQVPRLRTESRRTQTIGWQKLVASTLSSRGTRSRNQIENETTSSSGHTTQTATEEGDRGRGQGGGHKATPQQHDSLPTTDEHDAYNSNSPQLQSQQEEKGSSEVGQESSKVPKETESGSKKSTAAAKDKAKKKAAAAQMKKEQHVSFTVIQKSVRSLKTSDRV